MSDTSERSPLEWGLSLAEMARASGELDPPLRLAVTALGPGLTIDGEGRLTGALPGDARALTAKLMARAAMAIAGCIQAAADRCVATLRAGFQDPSTFHEPHVQASLGRLHAALAGARFFAADVLEQEPRESTTDGWRRQAAAAATYAAEQALAASQELGRWVGPGGGELQDSIRRLTAAAGALGPLEGQLVALADAAPPQAQSSQAQPSLIAEEVERRFGPLIAGKINPGIAERERAGSPVPRALLEEAGELGLLGFNLPAAIGGGGRDLYEWGLALEALGRSCPDGSFLALASLNASIAETLHELGREDIDQRYVRPMVQGRCLGSWSYTEGADPFSFRSLATRDGDGWVLKGDKKLITGGQFADLFVVYVGNGAGDLMAFLVQPDDPGVTVRAEPTLGLRAAGLASLSLDGVRLGAERLLVGSDGLSHAQRYLNRRRVLLVSPMVGAMRAMLDGCVARLGATERYGAPLLALSSVRSRVGRMAAAVAACEATLRQTLATMRDAPPGAPFDVPSALAKYLISREAVAMGEDLLRLMGTDGYLEGPWEKFLRDSMALLAAGGTQDLLEVALGGELARDWELRGQRSSSVKTA